MTKRLSDRQAEVDQRYVQMEHHRATLTAAQDAAEHAAVVCKNNFDTLTYAVQNERAERIAARKDVKEFRQDVKHLRSSLVYVFWTWGLIVAVVASFLAGMMNQNHRVAMGRAPGIGGTRERLVTFASLRTKSLP